MALPKISSFRKYSSTNYGTHTLKMETESMVLYYKHHQLIGYWLPSMKVGAYPHSGYIPGGYSLRQAMLKDMEDNYGASKDSLQDVHIPHLHDSLVIRLDQMKEARDRIPF